MLLIEEGSADVSVLVRLQDALSGAPKTGLTIGNLQVRVIWAENDNDVIVTPWTSLTALSGLTDDHTQDYAYEIGEGYYRIDVADSIFAPGTVFVVVLVRDNVENSILVARREIQVIWPKFQEAAKLLINKAVQDKSTGAIDYYDDDGSVIFMTHTPTDAEATITRTPS